METRARSRFCILGSRDSVIDYGNFQSPLTQTGSKREEIVDFEDSENQTPWKS